MNRLRSAMIAAIAIVSLIMPCGFATPAAATDYAALVIGNGQYHGADSRPGVIEDARAIAGMLRRIGFRVTEGSNLGRDAMLKTLTGFAEKLNGAKVALIFYSGGAVRIQGKDYLVAADAKGEGGSLTAEPADIFAFLAPVTSVSPVTLAFFDIDRTNPLKLTPPRPSSDALLGQVLIMFSAGPGQRAASSPTGHSPFVDALIKRLPTPGLDIKEVTRLIRADVVSATGQRQIPWDHTVRLGSLMLAPAEAR